jgi:hypothetical protein
VSRGVQRTGRRPPVALDVILVALVALAAAVSGCRATEVTDLDGGRVDPLAAPAAATVLVFLSTECPIANRYAPELLRLHARLAPRGVAFYAVYPLSTDTPDAVRAHIRAYGLPFDAIRDPQHVLVRRSGVLATPEVAVFLPGGRLAYRGRIDDREVALGQSRAEPTRRDLELVLEDVLAGRPIQKTVTTSIGCAIPPP